MASLAQSLFSASLERLQLVASTWGIDVPTSNSSRTLASFLYLEMSSTWYLRRVYESLSTEERHILNLLIDRNDASLSVDNLSRSLRLDQATLRHLIANLRRLSLIHLRKLSAPKKPISDTSRKEPPENGLTEKWAVVVYVELHSALRTIVRLMSSPVPSISRLRSHLLQLDITALQSIARSWGIERPHESERRELIALLLEFMGSQQQIELLVSKCSPGAQECYQRMKISGDVIPLTGDLFGNNTPQLRKSFEELIVNMLVFEVFEAGVWYLWTVEKVFFPKEGEKDSGAGDSIILGEKPMAIINREAFFGWAVLAVVSYFQRKLILVKPGNNYLPNEALTEIAGLIGVAETGRKGGELEFILHFVRAKGLIEKQEGVISISSALPSWGKMSRLAQVGYAANLWTIDRSWSASLEMPQPLWDIDVCPVRRKVLSELENLPSDEDWYNIDAFGNLVVESSPDLLQAINPARSFKRRQNILSVADDRKAELRRLIRLVISGPLFWFGLVELGQGGDTAVYAFRLTLTGRRVLRENNNLDDTSSGRHFAINDALEGRAEGFSGPVFYELARFADLQVIGPASKFVISRESVLRGMELGWTLVRMMEFLSEHHNGELPKKVTANIQTWANELADVVVSEVILVEFESPAQLRQLEVSDWGRTLIDRTIGPETAILKQGIGLKQFIELLKEHGYSPGVRQFDKP